ncbi:hypothetical protein AZE42_10663 [Rhizopogon vesiculosus]|uniref:Uncharacterized protein n=1 Tax=Rhizopogon vesiculosus TaxID=180088 RepID=A0A1J8PG49_9AGAM|nr:hypothetical protein AZE42_10663 [Rhizopogon vesiculosus]
MSAHCSALTSTQRLTNSREFVSVCMTQLSVESLITSATSRIGDNAFENAIREYQLEEQDDVGASESGGS